MALFRLPGQRRPRPPADLQRMLDRDERVVSWAPLVGGGYAVATPLGLWLGERRIGWHRINHAVWRDGTLTVTEATVVDDLLLVDRRPVSATLQTPYDLPQTVQKRVTASVVRSELQPVAGGAARFVARRVPGQDGVTWWARLEPGTPDTPAIREVLRERIATLARTAGMA